MIFFVYFVSFVFKSYGFGVDVAVGVGVPMESVTSIVPGKIDSTTMFSTNTSILGVN